MASVRLGPAARSPGQAREFLRSTLATWGPARDLEVVVLLTSELVTNAILHARSPMQVVVRRVADRVRIEVHDGSPVPPRIREYTAEEPSGRGLALVRSLSDAWGVKADRDGKAVWFELARSA